MEIPKNCGGKKIEKCIHCPNSDKDFVRVKAVEWMQKEESRKFQKEENVKLRTRLDELEKRVAALESPPAGKEERREWPEVEVRISYTCFDPPFIIAGNPSQPGLTRADAERVKRCYDEVVRVASLPSGAGDYYMAIGKKQARRILKGE